MDAVISFAVYGAVMVYCLARGISPAWSLVAAAVCFFLCGLYRRIPVKKLLKMSWSNMPASFKVLRILIVLGALTGLWRSCGTIPFCIYYGIRYIKPEMFIFVTFMINVMLSLALGTSLGVSSTSGVVLISLARFGGVDPLICAGAVMSGIYFGDRAAPTSSCANLVAAITDTKLYDDIRLMHKSGLPAYLISLVFYCVLSRLNPIGAVDETMMNALRTEFALSFLVVLPALIMIALPLLRVPLFISMAASGCCAALVSRFCQGMSLSKVLYTALMGFKPEGGMLAGVITGGGVIYEPHNGQRRRYTDGPSSGHGNTGRGAEEAFGLVEEAGPHQADEPAGPFLLHDILQPDHLQHHAGRADEDRLPRRGGGKA